MPNIRDRTSLRSGLDVKVQETSSAEGARKSQSYLIDIIDKADTIKKYRDSIDKMNQGTLDVPGFIRAMANNAAIEMAHLLHSSESEKIKLDVAKDILDRAGHGKTQKVAVGHMHVDHTTSRRELMNMILSSARKAGIETNSGNKRPDPKPANTIDAEILDQKSPRGDYKGGPLTSVKVVDGKVIEYTPDAWE